MYDYGLSVMEQYGLNVNTSYRGRGALICKCREGLFILRPFTGSKKRLEKQQEILMMLQEEHDFLVDTVIPTMEGELIATSSEEVNYVLRRWYEGKECDTRSKEEVLKSVSMLGRLHKAMHLSMAKEEGEELLNSQYERHNRELRKIRKFIKNKKVSNVFERNYSQSAEEFMSWAQEAVGLLEKSSYKRLYEQSMQEGNICHGEYNQHHILMVEEDLAITGFDKWKCDLQVGDLYSFMRKILEKYNWEISMGEQMLEAYEKERLLSPWEKENLAIRFAYPEKYWKLANYYYMHNKAWVSEKNTEKLQKIIEQRYLWREFVDFCLNTID